MRKATEGAASAVASAELHPQEVDLVWRGHSGVAIPARGYLTLRDEADALGPAYLHALYTQVARQTIVRCPEAA